jgi:Porin subfamily
MLCALSGDDPSMKRFAAAVVIFAVITGPVRAEDAVSADPSQSSAPADNPCAAYGEGYVSVNGGQTCLRVGGRIRYDMAVGAAQKPADE